MKISKEIGNLWNRILDKPGLTFDIEEAGIPVQLNENLQVYVKVKSTGQPLPYNSLSSGIRNYIFKQETPFLPWRLEVAATPTKSACAD